MIIRTERPLDADAIGSLTSAAFKGMVHSSGTEAAIVDALRREGALALSLVAEKDGLLVGHVAFSPVTIDGKAGGWFGLGPVSVLPAQQRSGTGSALIREGLERLKKLAQETLPPGYSFDYSGPSRQFIHESGGLVLTFFFAIVIILWAQPLINCIGAYRQYGIDQE